MNYQKKLLSRTQSVSHSICMGMDPVTDKIPLEGKPEDIIKEFYENLLNEMVKKSVFPAAVKPNIAFYEGQNIECLYVLKNLIASYQKEGVLVVLDAKRGDIGKTSSAYADMAFDVFGADAVTVAPYMGSDSIAPFTMAYPGRGVYVLVRTSNSSAGDFQNHGTGGRPLYMEVAERIDQWNEGDLGAVVGATAPRELEELTRFWKSHKGEIPMLIPGVSVKGVSGGQGGSLGETVESIRLAGGDPLLHLINSSSGINYAYEAYPGKSYSEAAVLALEGVIAEQEQAMKRQNS